MKASRVHSCNVLQVGADFRKLWEFNVSTGTIKVEAEIAGLPTEPLPANKVAKDWRSLWRTKLNLAWLPSEQVFLRVVHLPAGAFSELLSMVELQLEKLSPLPVAQIVWSIEVVPSRTPVGQASSLPVVAQASSLSPDSANLAASATAGSPEDRLEARPTTTAGTEAGLAELQTVVVLIVARSFVEEFLGQLEGQGYLADRLELPILHQLLATQREGDGVWIYPWSAGAKQFCLAAWWNGGLLQNLNLVRLTTGENWGAILIDQLTQTAWAGEMEGWLSGPLRYHLVADPETAAAWEPLLAQWVGQPLTVSSPLTTPELASLNAQRAARAETTANLLPAEFGARYRQQFIDGLWMRSLGVLGVLYVAGLIIYFAALQVVYFQQHRMESKIGRLRADYTNSMQLKARVQVLQDQVNLKFAALECYKAAAELLPPELTLTDLSFQQGRVLTLHGEAPADQANQILEYNKALGQVRLGGTNGPLLFSKVQPYNATTRPAGGGLQMLWSFNCELARTDIE